MSQTLEIMKMGEQITELEKQLVQAKEIIKGLLDLLHNEAYRTRCYEEMQKAEQFIKEKQNED